MAKLLFVDDEEAVLNALRRSLRKHLSLGVQISSFTDPVEALHVLSKERFDVIVADYQMPQMNGVKFLTLSKRWQTDAIRIILSATEDFSVLKQAINDANIRHFVPKPWDDTALATLLKQSINEIKEYRIQYQLANERRLDLNAITPQELERRNLEQQEPGLTHVNWGPNGEVILES